MTIAVHIPRQRPRATWRVPDRDFDSADEADVLCSVSVMATVGSF
jgi:hypothetical protein